MDIIENFSEEFTSALPLGQQESAKTLLPETEIMFVDSGIDNYQSIISQVDSNAEVILLDSQTDGIVQITDILADRNNISAIHIVSHGDSGSLQLGSADLNSYTLQTEYDELLGGWSNALTSDADLLFYGCNVGAGSQGSAFVDQLAQITGADINASDDLTGHAALGGDWDLEVQQGAIETSLAFDPATVNYNSTLVTFNPAGGAFNFTGTATADELYFEINASNQLTYSTDNSVFTSTSFSLGSVTSITIDLLGDDDSVFFNSGAGSWANFSGDITVDSETIALNTINLGTTSTAGILDFNADASGTTSAIADISITNSVLTADSLSLTASSDVTNTATGNQNITNNASAFISGGTINVDNLSIDATTTGNVDSTSETLSILDLVSFDESVTNTVSESAIAYVDGATVNVNTGLNVSALSNSDYTATGISATNDLSGDVTAYINNSTINSSNGNVTVSAQDNTSLTANSAPEEFVDINVTVLDISAVSASAENKFARATEAYVTNADVNITSGDLDVDALRDVSLTSDTNTITATTAETSVDLALSGSSTFASNTILGDVQAYVEDSTVDILTSGSVLLDAQDTSAIDARTEAGSFSVAEGIFNIFNLTDTAISSSIAFNSVGWDVDPAAQAIETLIGTATDFGGVETPADVQAYIKNSSVDAAGDVNLTATSEIEVNATVSNTAETTSSALFGSRSLGIADILASNLVSSTAQTYINNDSTTNTVEAGGDISLSTNDNAGIFSNSKLVSTSSTTNDGGALLNGAISSLLNADFDSSDGSTALSFGDRVRLADDYAVADFDSDPDFGLTTNIETVNPGDFVQVLDGYIGGGTGGSIYKYIGSTGSIDLSSEDYDNGNWVEVTGTAGTVYEYLGSGATIDLSAEMYTNLDIWKEVTETTIIPEGYNISASDAIAIGGLVVRNEVKNDVNSYINNANVITNDGSVDLSAIANATIEANADSAVSASGGSAYGTGTVIAANGTIAANLIQGDTKAYITNASVITVDGASGLGNINLDARNTSQIDATSLSATTSGDTAVGVTLAFNTIGWASQDILTSTIDAILLTNIGTETTDQVHAYIADSTINADGDISLNANSQAQLNATVSNEATSAASALYGATGISTSGILASNLVSTSAQAYIEDTTQSLSTVVNAGGNISITAQDTAGIDANNNLLAESATTNDGGASLLNNLVSTILSEYDYTTESGTQDLNESDQVFVASTFNNSLKGTEGDVYRFIVSGGELGVDLANEDFTDELRWERLDPSDEEGFVPAGLNVTGSDSVAIGGLVVRNDVRSEAQSYIDFADVTATSGNISLTADESATIQANSTSIATSSGGSAYGTGVSLAINGAIATNSVVNDALAYITNSTVDTTSAGNISLDAQNNSLIDATLSNSIQTGDTAVGVTLAYNTLGWQANDLFSQTLDALLGTSFATEKVAESLAYIEDSTVSAAGDISLFAASDALLNATVSNAADSTASALFGATGLATTGILASNRVSSVAQAYIDSDFTYTEAEAEVLTILSFGTTLNTGDRIKLETGEIYEYLGASIDFASVTLPTDFSADSNWSLIPRTNNQVDAAGSISVNAQDNAGIFANSKLISSSSTSNDGGAGIIDGIIGNEIEANFDTEDGVKNLEFGDRVRILDGFDDSLGTAGDVYEYLGTATTGLGIDLSSEDYTNQDFWKVVTVTNVIPQGNNISASDAIAIGGLVVRNEVSGGAEAYINNAQVDANDGDIQIEASENAIIDATADAAVDASGGSAYGTGTVIAANATVATNIILSNANAYITNSEVDAVDAGSGLGNIVVNAENTSTIDAENLSATNTGDTAFSVTFALNTVGWEAQNILFSVIDSILSTDIGDQDPAQVQAYIADSTVNADGDVSTTAVSQANINALVDNDSTSSASALFGATGQALGGVLASNLVSSFAKAYIGDDPDGSSDTLSTTVNAGGAVTISAEDNAGIDAVNSLIVESTTTNDFGESIFRNFVDTLASEYEYTTNSGTQDLTQFEQVYVASDYDSLKGTPGVTYQFVGNDETGVDLGNEDYTVTSRWEKVDTDFITSSTGLNFSDSDSIAIAGLIVRNDVRSQVDSFINVADVTSTSAGNITLTASENAVIQAASENVTASSGGSAFGTGTSLAVGGTIANNQVTSEANAFITNATAQTTNGDVILDAQNTSQIDATMLSSLTTGDTGVGFTVAFNTLGWASQDIVTQTIDTILGTSIGTEQPAQVRAFIENADVTANGDLSLNAVSSALINATVSNSSISSASALFGATGLSVGGILSSNKVSTNAEAYIADTNSTDSLGTTADVTGGVTINADDSAGIYSNSKIVSSSTTSNDGGVAIANDFINNVIPTDFDTGDGVKNIAFGDTVRLADDYANGGTGGSAYKYLGTFTTGASLDLSNEDYSNLDFWVEIPITDLIPEGNNISDSDAIAVGGTIVVNRVSGDVSAYIDNATVIADTGAVNVTATENAVIDATLDSIAEASGGSAYGSGTVIAANGAIASNFILSAANAYINDSTVTATLGNILVDAANTSTLTAENLSSTTSGDQAFGVILAFNTLGWDTNELNILISGVTNLIDDPSNVLDAFDGEQPAEVKAYINNSQVAAGGNLKVEATSTAQIDALVKNESTSAAAALVNANGASVGFIFSSNKVSSTADAYIQNSTSVMIDGGITINAEDNAGIASDIDFLVESTTTNDAGLSILGNFIDTLTEDYQYTTNSGEQEIVNGDKVYIASDYTSGGTQTESYIYTGTGETIDLGTINYATDPDWELVSSDNVLSDAYNFLSDNIRTNVTDSNSIAVGGVITFNDVRSAVNSYIDSATVDADTGSITITALENATIDTNTNSVVTSDGGSITGGGFSIAINGVIASNAVLSEASAYILDSDVTLAGDLTIDAQNTSSLNAVVESDTESKGVAVGVVLALNTVGTDFFDLLVTPINSSDDTDGDDIDDSVTDSIGNAIADIFTENPATVKAYIENSGVVAGGAIDINATNDASIIANQAASSTAINVSLNQSVSVAIAANLALNYIETQTQAYIDTASSNAGTTRTVQANGGNLTIDAQDMATITADVTSSSLAVSAGTATSVGVTIGASITVNDIQSDVLAEIRGADAATIPVSASGDIAINASGQSTLDVTAIASALSISLGTSTSVSVAGAGALAFNDITSSVEAAISDGSEVTATGAVSLTATDNANIITDAGGYALAASLGTTGIAGGLGLAIADNDIQKQTSAAIKGANTTVSGTNVSATANSTGVIEALTLAGGIAVAGGTSAAIAVAGSGAIATNDIINTTQAVVEDGASVTATTNNVSLIATDNSTITSDAGSVAAGLSLSLSGGGSLAVGAGVATNTINNTVQAYVDNGTVNAQNGDVTLSATSNNDIDSLAASIAGAFSVAVDLAVALAGAGADATNTITSTTAAYIQNGSDVDADGTLSVTALDDSNITSDVGALAFSASGGTFSGSVSIGVTLAENDIQNHILAYIGQESSAGVDTTTVDAGNINLSADSTSTIETTAIAVAAAAAVSIGGGLAGGGADATNNTAKTIAAFIRNGSTVTSDTGAIDISATDVSNVSSTVGSGGFSIGLIGGSVGVSLVDNTVANNVRAYIDDAKVTAATELNLDATSTVSNEAIGVATSFALGLAGAFGGAGAEVTTSENTVVESFINDTATDDNPDIIAQNVNLTATRNINANYAEAFGFSGALGGGVSLAVGVSVPTVTLGGAARSYISGADVDASGTVNLDSSVITPTVDQGNDQGVFADATGIAAAGGTAAVATVVNQATVTINPTIESYISSGADVAATNDINLTSEAQLDADVDASGISVAIGGLSFAVNATLADVDINPTVSSYVEGSSVTSNSGNILLQSAHNYNTTTDSDRSGYGADANATAPISLGITAAGTGSDADATSAADVDTYVDSTSTLSAGGIIAVESFAYNDSKADASGLTLAGGVGVGVSLASANNSSAQTKARVDGIINDGTALTILSVSTSEAEADAEASGGSIAASGQGAVATAVDSPNVITRIGDGANGSNINISGDITVTSQSETNADADGSTFTIAGGASVGVVEATATTSPDIDTYVGAGSTVTTSNGSFTLESAHNYSPGSSGSIITGANNYNVDGNSSGQAKGAHSDTDAAGVAIGASVASTTSTATANANVQTYIESNETTINALNGTVTLRSRANNDADAAADGEGNSGIASVGNVNANADADGTTQSYIDGTNTLIINAANLTVLSTVTNDADASTNSAANSGFASVTDNDSTADASPNVKASVAGHDDDPNAGNILISGTVNITATAQGNTNADSGSKSGAIAGVSSSESTAQWQPTVIAEITGSSTELEANDINIQAYNNYNESGTVQSSNEARANADSTGEGIAGVAGATANIIINSDVQARIGGGVDITTDTNLDVIAQSRNKGGGKADNEASGVAGIGSSTLDADMASNTQAYVQDSTSSDPGSINSTGNGTIQFFSESDNEFFDSGSSNLGLGSNAVTGAGGAVGVGGSDASVELNSPVTEAAIGNYTNINADNATLDLNAENNALLGVRTDGEATGFLGFNEADAIARVNNGQTNADIGDNVTIVVDLFSMIANDKDIDVRAEADSDIGAFGGTVEADTQADATLNAQALVGDNSTITAPTKVTIKSTAEAVKTRSYSFSNAEAVGAEINAFSNSDKDVSTDINVNNNGSEIATSELEVLAIAPPNDDGSSNLWSATSETTDSTVLGTLIDIAEGACEVVGEVAAWGARVIGVSEPDLNCDIDNPEVTENSSGKQRTVSSITFNADITVLNDDDNPIFEVDSAGVVQQLDGVTATNNGSTLSVGDTVNTSVPIVVDKVTNETDGTILIQSNRGGTAGFSNINYDAAFDTIDILNASIADLEINNIDPSPDNNEADIQELGNDGELNWDYTLTTLDNGTDIQINNSNTSGGDVTVVGEIFNSLGLTTIISEGGNITNDVNGEIYTLDAAFSAAGTIGLDADNRLAITLVVTEDTDVPSIQQAQGDNGVYLDLTPRTFNDALTEVNIEVFNVGSELGDVDILINEAEIITFTLTSTDPVAFTTGATPIDLNVDLGPANVAGDLIVVAGDDDTVTTNVNIVDTLSADGTIFLTVLDAIQASAGTELAGGGAVLDADTIEALDTQLDNLEATAANSGVSISNTGGITIGSLTDKEGISAMGDVSIITSAESLDVIEDITATANTTTGESGDITLDANDTALRDTDLLLIYDFTSLVSDGDVTLRGGDEVLLEINSDITAIGSLTVQLDTGDNIDFGSSIATIAGEVNVASASISGNNDQDALRLERLTTNVGWTMLSFNGENDNLYGTNLPDVITSEDGDDQLDGDAGDDLLTSGDGNDLLRGDEGNDTLDGGADDDNLEGGTGNDSLLGGSGNDVLEGGADSDILDAGAGVDTVSYDSSNSGVTVDLTTSTASGGDAEGDSIINFENIIGSDFDDNLTGDDSDNELTGNSGSDEIIGGDGQDLIEGGANNDTLEGGLGSDTLDGGSGDDIFVGVDPTVSNPGQGELDVFNEASGSDVYILGADGTYYYDDGNNAANGTSDYALINSFIARTDTISLASGFTYYLAEAPGGTIAGKTGLFVETNGINGYGETDELIALLASVDAPDVPLEILVTEYTGEAGQTQTADIEAVVGPVFDNEISGTSLNDRLIGTDFNDSISAGDGNDYVRGLDGDDLLEGEAGNDRLLADDGNDTVDGGSGADYLIGGNNNDLLKGGADNDQLKGGNGDDIIIGVDENSSTAGQGEIDKLYGNAGADTFILGADGQVYYDDGDTGSNGQTDYGLIYDFNDSEDTIQLANIAGGKYFLSVAPAGLGTLSNYTAIYFDVDGDGLDITDEVIAILYRITTPVSPEEITAATLGFVFDN